MGGMGAFLVFAVVLWLYPLVALGRIWLYSKQQALLLREIRDLLRKENPA
jgi:heme exporter protein D